MFSKSAAPVVEGAAPPDPRVNQPARHVDPAEYNPEAHQPKRLIRPRNPNRGWNATIIDNEGNVRAAYVDPRDVSPDGKQIMIEVERQQGIKGVRRESARLENTFHTVNEGLPPKGAAPGLEVPPPR